MTSAARCFTDKCSGTTDKRTIASSSDNHESLTTFNSGRSITMISLMFIDSKRFSGNGRLIDLDKGIVGDDSTIGRDNSTFFNLDDVAGYHFGGFDLDESAVSEANGLKRQGFLQLFDDGASLVFLDETDRCIEEK